MRFKNYKEKIDLGTVGIVVAAVALVAVILWVDRTQTQQRRALAHRAYTAGLCHSGPPAAKAICDDWRMVGGTGGYFYRCSVITSDGVLELQVVQYESSDVAAFGGVPNFFATCNSDGAVSIVPGHGAGVIVPALQVEK